MNYLCILCDSLNTSFFLENNKNSFYKCNDCDIIFRSPNNFLTIPDQKKRYSQHNNSYEDKNYVAFLNTLINPLRKYLLKNISALDYGCGPGPAISKILKNYDINALNYDPNFFNDITLLEKKYDLVTCTEVVEHFHSPKEDWVKLTNLVNPKGILGIMTDFRDSKDFKTWYYKDDPTHVIFYSQKTMQILAKKYDFTILEMGNRYCILKSNKA